MELSYLVRRIAAPPLGELALDSPQWQRANELEISHFHARSSDHRPRTRARVLHDAQNLYLRFDVEDRYVIARSTHFQDMVCFDSCVEFFFRPKRELGYFNLEINCGGTFLCYYVEDATPTDTGLAKYTPVSAEQAARLSIQHSLPATVFPERKELTNWRIAVQAPRDVFEHYIGALGCPADWKWDGNFYKCADHSSHPHWASWAPLGEKLNFHSPQYFKSIRFEK